MTKAAHPRSAEPVGGAIRVSGGIDVSTLLLQPARQTALYVLAHGAGAGMRHPFMESIAQRLAAHGIGTLRYQFPYTEQGSRRPDPEPLLLATVRAAVAAGREAAGTLPLLAGGKSMGGRMTSRAAASEALPGVAGVVFLGFPLHPAGQPGVSRAEHLARVDIPMLFLQGTRDTLADLTLLGPVVERLGDRATLRVIEQADHSFHVLKRSGRTDEQVLDELAIATAEWRESLT
ncbi:MAG: alpha/beta hydrolase [Candidatus Eisenbacteria bacterium]|uniref:Alpha/beta hydrolase n=1 Tax=Eiseniibacteriota bacterium TaxID=2212470 RepID=A0A538TJG8_UNCEI|nr:MAG: alpha/beta hydrolase [Candidatus Eisenbacteria bacterium]